MFSAVRLDEYVGVGLVVGNGSALEAAVPGDLASPERKFCAMAPNNPHKFEEELERG